tara:strand:- start:2511 stop:2666 length:156 start_codon:yes stop_codon:yes gene_type:complete
MKMIHCIKRWLSPVQDMPAWLYYLKLITVILMFMLAYCMAQQDNPFFYQAF